MISCYLQHMDGLRGHNIKCDKSEKDNIWFYSYVEFKKTNEQGKNRETNKSPNLLNAENKLVVARGVEGERMGEIDEGD